MQEACQGERRCRCLKEESGNVIILLVLTVDLGFGHLRQPFCSSRIVWPLVHANSSIRSGYWIYTFRLSIMYSFAFKEVSGRYTATHYFVSSSDRWQGTLKLQKKEKWRRNTGRSCTMRFYIVLSTNPMNIQNVFVVKYRPKLHINI